MKFGEVVGVKWDIEEDHGRGRRRVGLMQRFVPVEDLLILPFAPPLFRVDPFYLCFSLFHLVLLYTGKNIPTEAY